MQTTHTTKHYTATTWERSQKKPLANCAVVTNAVPRQMSRPAANQSDISNYSTMGPSPSSRTHTIVDPPVPVEHQKNTLITAPMKTTDPSHSAWGLASPTVSHSSAKDSDI